MPVADGDDAHDDGQMRQNRHELGDRRVGPDLRHKRLIGRAEVLLGNRQLRAVLLSHANLPVRRDLQEFRLHIHQRLVRGGMILPTTDMCRRSIHTLPREIGSHFHGGKTGKREHQRISRPVTIQVIGGLPTDQSLRTAGAQEIIGRRPTGYDIGHQEDEQRTAAERQAAGRHVGLEQRPAHHGGVDQATHQQQQPRHQQPDETDPFDGGSAAQLVLSR